jgi:uncharacterized membrane protein
MIAIATTAHAVRTLVGPGTLIAYLALAAGTLPVWPFSVHLALHIAGAAMLIGNAVVMAVWLIIAGQAGGDDAKRRAARAVNLGDVWFTIPGVVLILANGLALVFQRYGGLAAFTTTPWIAAGLVLLTLTGLVWALRLVPAQLRLLELAGRPGPLDRPAFGRTLVGWYVWGSVATVLPIIAVVLMTTKPALG